MSTLKAIDLFAGLGGFTEGATQAGVDVVWAANHWRVAVDSHELNHPNTTHACQDLAQTDFTRVPAHDLLLASPACQGHAHARGKDRPHHDSNRSTAWAILACAEARLPANILVENVPEFTEWKQYPAWRLGLELYGYTIREHIFDATDFGVPQARRRLFITASLAGPLELVSPGIAAPSFRSVLDWDSGKWSPVATKCEKTRDQVARATAKHGEQVSIVYNGVRNAGRDLEGPAPTVTTVDRLAIIDGDRMRMLTTSEYRRLMGFRDSYRLSGTKKEQIKLLGNAVAPPVARELVAQIAAIAA